MEEKKSYYKYVLGAILAAIILFNSGTCGASNNNLPPSQPSLSVSPSVPSKPVITPPSELPSITPKQPTYADSRWPTNNSTLLAIPENDRWYTAKNRVGTYGTIAGPVVRVYQAKDAQGMPIFIDIGNPYPNQNRAQIVIWARYLSDFEDMLYQIVPGTTWISATGRISEYDGVPELDTGEGYIECLLWTNIRN